MFLVRAIATTNEFVALLLQGANISPISRHRTNNTLWFGKVLGEWPTHEQRVGVGAVYRSADATEA